MTDAIESLQPDSSNSVINSISKTDAEAAYRFFLNRTPENIEVVTQLLATCKSFDELRSKFIASSEFKEKVAKEVIINVPRHKPLVWPYMAADVNVTDATLVKMLAHVEGNWRILGEKDPHWSVLIADQFRRESIGNNLEAFYNSGKATLGYFHSALERARLDGSRFSKCFELGCGVGRLTLLLSELCDQVIAGDVSYPHLALGSEMAKERSIHNVEFILMDSMNCLDSIEDTDLFFSIIVLQHNPPPVIAFLLKQLLSKLRQGGLGYFQVPTAGKKAFEAESYMRSAKLSGAMEVHALPQIDLFNIIQSVKCEILDIRENGWTGSDNFVSNSILVRKT